MIVDINMKVNSPKAWILAARPKTLTGAIVPVMLGAAYAWHMVKDYNKIEWGALALCFLFAMLMQIDANFINDYFDCKKGRDNEERLGPLRACQQGWVTLSSMRIAIMATTMAACIVGLPLIYYGGYEMLIVGVLCVIFCFLYTVCLAGMGLGDLLVVVFFGLVPCCCTYYVAVPQEYQTLQQMPWLLALANGLMTDTLLLVNNYRDIDNDRNAGKKTLVVYIGKKYTEWLFLYIVPIALCLVLLEFGWTNMNIILCFGVYFFHVSTWNELRSINKGKALNGTLGKTARNILIFGVLMSFLVIIAE